MLTLSDFDFDLPPESIAQATLPGRTASRLLAVYRAGDAVHFEDRQFADLVDYLRPGNLLIFDDTRVIKTRFFGQEASGGRVEVFVERLLNEYTVLAQIRSSKSPVEGTTLCLANAFDTTVGPRVEPFSTLRFLQPALDLVGQYGRLPLPLCIEYDPNNFNETRYQTMYVRNPGTMAAPTAGLHFDDALFTKLDVMGVQRGLLTLHVDAGTFRPVHMENVAEHRTHSEWYEITPELAEAIRATRAAGGRTIAADTTSMRALESAAQPDGTLNACNGETDTFIAPGYRFRAVNLLVANSHLPKSTLLMLVSAFAGMSAIREAYQHTIVRRYRLFSYGNIMLLTCAPTEPGEPGGIQSF